MGTLKRLFGKKQFWFSFAAACVPAFILEPLAEEWTAPSAEASSSIFDVHGLYRRRVTGLWRQRVPNFTAIVEIREGREPSWAGMTSVCKQRGFIAELLKSINKCHPDVIVIDKYFEATTCSAKDGNTQNLLDAAKQVTKDTPLVVGRIENSLHVDDRFGWSPALVFAPGKDNKGNSVEEGDITFDEDVRRIPLRWEVWNSADAKTGQNKDSLALKAATARNADLLQQQPRLNRIINQNKDPYTSFIDIPVVSANTLLFGDHQVSEQDWQKHIIDQPDKNVAAKLRGKVVLIGENRSDIDQHMTDTGDVPGCILHANYIESILDQWYFEPVGWFWNMLAGFLIFSVFHLILILCEQLLGRKFISKVAFIVCSLAATVLTLAAAYVVLGLLVLLVGRYVDPLNVSGTAISVLILHGLFYGVGEGHVQQKSTTTPP